MKKLVFLIVLMAQIGFSQVGINTASPNAQLDIRSGNQVTPSITDGLLIPKIDAFPIANPTALQQGMMVYLTTTSLGKLPGFYYWDNITVDWIGFGGANGWGITGNTGINDAVNFIGTTNNANLVFKRNNLTVGRLTASGISFGEGALSPTSTGSNNTALGYQSMFSNTTGFSNVATGYQALYSNTTGQLNVAQGFGALDDNTTGNQNNAIGHHALNNNVSGSYNNAFGAEANVAAGNLTNATAIGSNAMAASSNSIILGSINGVNGASSTASVGIGTTVPNAVFDVASSSKGILIPRVALTATGQVLPVTNPQGGALPVSTMVYNTQTIADVYPGFYYWNGTKWARFDIDGEGKPKYYTVAGTTNTTATAISSPYPEMTQTFTPNSATVFVNFSTGGYNVGNACGQNAVYFTLLLDGIPIKGFQTSMEDINSNNRPIWDLSTSYPVTLTPGVPHTISINWNVIGGVCPANGVTNNVAAAIPPGGYQAYRVLTVIDPNGGGGVVGSAPVIYPDAWKVDGNAGTNPATNFIGTVDNVDLIFKRNNIAAGELGVTNTAFGVRSLMSNTSGISNAGFGTHALIYNSTGSYNSAVGNQALANNTVGNYNVAVGQAALATGSSESWSTAVGYNAMLYSNSSTTPFNGYNTALGGNALRGSTSASANTGNHNTALGVQALFVNTSGSYNTAAGVNSLISNTTGSTNTSIGVQALNNNQTGSGNVALGYQAGLTEMGSNRLYIENSSSTTPLIYGEFDTDLARINGNFRVKSPSNATAEMQVKNSNIYNHPSDANLNFGVGGGYFMVSTQDGSPSSETAGIRGDGDNVTIWSPCDGGRVLRFVDEDAWGDNNGNPYDFGAEVAYIGSNGQYFQVSDQNKKENIRKIEDATDKISKISGYTYQYKLSKPEIEKGQKPVPASGVLAQEMEKVLPEAVQKNEYGEYFVDYAAITPLLIEAIKDQNAKIKSLEATNAEILRRLEQLEKK